MTKPSKSGCAERNKVGETWCRLGSPGIEMGCAHVLGRWSGGKPVCAHAKRASAMQKEVSFFNIRIVGVLKGMYIHHLDLCRGVMPESMILVMTLILRYTVFLSISFKGGLKSVFLREPIDRIWAPAGAHGAVNVS